MDDDAFSKRLFVAMGGPQEDAVRRWADSGAMNLAGPSGEEASIGPARLALAMDHWAEQLATSTSVAGVTVEVDGAALLGERAALMGFGRRGSVSASGQTQHLQAADGWLALTMARVDDAEMLEAWLESSVRAPARIPFHGWDELAALVADRPLRALVERASLLGLPCAAVGEVVADDVGLVASTFVEPGGTGSFVGLRVVDLSSLWAGPLCAQLLGLAGADVVKVESSSRPDGARFGSPQLFDLLHAGHRSVAVDFSSEAGRRDLLRLIDGADIVIEASRPRALQALGASFDRARERGWRGRWLSITAYGNEHDQAMRVGFGDDAASAGGLVVWQGGTPMFCSDAGADPMTGLLAATALSEFVASGLIGRLDVTLAGTAAHVAAGIRHHGWCSSDQVVHAKQLQNRQVTGRARPMGADNDQLLGHAEPRARTSRIRDALCASRRLQQQHQGAEDAQDRAVEAFEPGGLGTQGDSCTQE